LHAVVGIGGPDGALWLGVVAGAGRGEALGWTVGRAFPSPIHQGIGPPDGDREGLRGAKRDALPSHTPVLALPSGARLELADLPAPASLVAVDKALRCRRSRRRYASAGFRRFLVDPRVALDNNGFLGITSSPSCVAEPECRGVAERLDERVHWVHWFETNEGLRVALRALQHRHHRTWLVRWHGHVASHPVRRKLVPRAVRAA
jgi:hypothetical protein